MQILTVAFAAAIYAAGSGLSAAGPSPAPYSAVEVDPFVPDRGVAFPADYQTALVDDIARETSIAFKTIIIVRAGDPPPFGHAVLRISGTVVGFKPGNFAKRSLIGFGAGGTVVSAQVRLADASTGQVLLIREVKGAPENLARKIAKLCSAARLVNSD